MLALTLRIAKSLSRISSLRYILSMVERHHLCARCSITNSTTRLARAHFSHPLQILRALRPPTSPQRVALTRAVFDMIDQDRDGLLNQEEVCTKPGRQGYFVAQQRRVPGSNTSLECTFMYVPPICYGGDNHGMTGLDGWTDIEHCSFDEHRGRTAHHRRVQLRFPFCVWPFSQP